MLSLPPALEHLLGVGPKRRHSAVHPAIGECLCRIPFDVLGVGAKLASRSRRCHASLLDRICSTAFDGRMPTPVRLGARSFISFSLAHMAETAGRIRGASFAAPMSRG